MERSTFEGRFYATYHYASVVHNILRDQMEYSENLEGFYGDDEYLQYANPFPRWSAFHSFIAFVIDAVIAEEPSDLDLSDRQAMYASFKSIPAALKDLQPAQLPIEEELGHYNLGYDSFEKWLSEKGKRFAIATEDDVGDYYAELRLCAVYDELITKATHEVFYILFQNRALLILFHNIMSAQMQEAMVADLELGVASFFARDGVLRRVSIPTWVKRAVFFRDRGHCSLCQRDLSGLLSIDNSCQYDHIVPLAKGGLNDVTNIQLLCDGCNSGKRADPAITSDHYELWYPAS